ncbi:MAG: addiction module protein [Verrucomicrobia bacterium]|nr:addiction module protein [Verrucomicrobiota bacterium]
MPITLPLKKMSRSDKLIAMEALWTDLSADDAKLDSPSWHAEVLKETERLVRSGKAKFMDWDEAKMLLRRKAAKLA